MLKIQAKPLDVEYSITHKYDGKKVLEFEVSTDHSLYSNIRQEIQVDEKDNYYVVKSIQELGGSAQIECDLDMDSLKSTMFKTFTTETLSLSETLSQALTGTGWTAIDAELVAIRRSMELENVTPYEVVFATEETYNCVYKINTKQKTLTVIKPQNVQWDGAYITDQVNLRRVDYKGDTYEFCTRLYPYGVKNEDGVPLTIASVNNGKTYIDNFEYTDKIIVGTWSDERYTVAQSLKDDAIEMLKTLSRPVESYQLDVVDIANMDNQYEQLKIELYGIVMLLDRKRNQKIEHRVVEYVENPLHPEKNQVTLSTVIQKIETTIIGKIETIEAENLITQNKVNEIKRDVDTNTARISNTYTKGETDTEIASQITQATDDIRLEAKQEVTTQVQAIQIGGRNLLANSDIKITRTKDSTSLRTYVLYVVEGYDLNTLIGKQLTASIYTYSPGERDVSLSVDANLQDRFGIHVTLRWADDSGGTTTTYPATDLLDQTVEDGKRIYSTFEAEPPNGYTHLQICAVTIQQYARPASTNNATWVLSRPKLELGNKPTDWTPAPEDTDEAINDAANNVIQTITERTSAAIDIAHDNILSTVSKEYSTKDELEEARQYTDTKVQQTADSITYTFTTVQEAIDLIDGKVDQNKLDMEEYIRFAGAMIELGKRGNPFVAQLTNTELAFLQNGAKVAYISNNKLYITDAEMKGKLTMAMVGGFFDWVPEQNGSMSLVWRDA